MHFVSKFESIFGGIHAFLLVASEGYLFSSPFFSGGGVLGMAVGSSIALDGAMKAALREAPCNHRSIKQHPQLSGIDGYRICPNSQALLEVLRPWVFVLRCWVLDMVSVTMLVVKSELESFFSIDLYLTSCHGLC